MTSSKSPTWNTDSKVKAGGWGGESLASSLDIALKECFSLSPFLLTHSGSFISYLGK